ncbi:hypothetical protein Bbelb_343480 [Branchiostoma belcheri]|nr:hypothetical protein Bbelb_343480 [Branchiostoma belcheri]
MSVLPLNFRVEFSASKNSLSSPKKGYAIFVKVHIHRLDNAGENLSDILQDEEAMNIMETIGWTKASTTSEDVPTLKRTICLHDIILKRKTAIDQIHQGLGTFGLIDAFDKNPSLLEELLNLKNEKVTADEASQMFMIMTDHCGDAQLERVLLPVRKYAELPHSRRDEPGRRVQPALWRTLLCSPARTRDDKAVLVNLTDERHKSAWWRNCAPGWRMLRRMKVQDKATNGMANAAPDTVHKV